jgi:hypothetical protein
MHWPSSIRLFQKRAGRYRHKKFKDPNFRLV